MDCESFLILKLLNDECIRYVYSLYNHNLKPDTE
jgi:hypothetical protein